MKTRAAAGAPASVPDLDHIAHFVPERESCRRALVRLGFAPAPFSLQYHRLDTTQPLVPAGTGNHCVMLREGYLEFLVPLADTGVAAQLRTAIDRYVGVHSIVFGTSDAMADRERLQDAGFLPAPALALQRPIETASGNDTARFTVVRVPPGAMAEGRIQFCQHHTRELVWQDRWLAHPNGAIGLTAAFVCVQDLDEAAARYARFTGQSAQPCPDKRVFRLRRGRIELYDAAGFAKTFGIESPALPCIAGCEVMSRDLGATRATLAESVVPMQELDGGRIVVRGDASIGGTFVFTHGTARDPTPTP